MDFQGIIDELTHGLTLPGIIKILLNTAISFGAIVAVGYLILNGFKYMTSSGDTGKTEEAQKGLSNALIGLVIVLAAAVIVNFVIEGVLGINLGGLDTP